VSLSSQDSWEAENGKILVPGQPGQNKQINKQIKENLQDPISIKKAECGGVYLLSSCGVMHKIGGSWARMA
jgi:hypothetical protein